MSYRQALIRQQAEIQDDEGPLEHKEMCHFLELATFRFSVKAVVGAKFVPIMGTNKADLKLFAVPVRYICV